MNFLSNTIKRGPISGAPNSNLSDSLGKRFKDENQYKTTTSSTMGNSLGSQNRTMTQGLSDLTNIIKNTRVSYHSDEMQEKGHIPHSNDYKMEDLSRTLHEILSEIRIKLKEKAKKTFKEACHVDIDKEGWANDSDLKLKNLRQLVLYLSRTRTILKEELDQRENNTSNSANEYEGLIQKLEADIRGHIRIEQQLKLYAENTQSKLDDMERDQKRVLDEHLIKIENYEGKNKLLKEEAFRKQAEIDKIRFAIEEKKDLIRDLIKENTYNDQIEKKNEEIMQIKAQKRENIADKNKFIGGIKALSNEIEQQKMSVQDGSYEYKINNEGANKKKHTPDGSTKLKENHRKSNEEESESLKEKKLIKMLQKQLEQKDNEIRNLQKKIQEISKVEESPPLKDTILGIKKGISPPSSKVSSHKTPGNGHSNTNSKNQSSKHKNECPSNQYRNKSSKDVIEDFTKSLAEKKIVNSLGRDPSPLKKYRNQEYKATSNKKENENNRSTSVDANNKNFRQTKTKIYKEENYNKGRTMTDFERDGGLKGQKTFKNNSNIFMNHNVC